jgi:hypothetical protein
MSRRVTAHSPAMYLLTLSPVAGVLGMRIASMGRAARIPLRENLGDAAGLRNQFPGYGGDRAHCRCYASSRGTFQGADEPPLGLSCSLARVACAEQTTDALGARFGHRYENAMLASCGARSCRCQAGRPDRSEHYRNW